uniref:Uncharacterized protein n=1 Tax=viral metagenome TaxID=1070528 RepID=A0A6H2A1U5_9ZZZZ
MEEQARYELAAFSIEAAVIATLDAKFGDITVITDKNSYDFVMGGLREYRDLRIQVVEEHKLIKGPLLKKTKEIDAKKKEYLDLLAPGEERLKAVRKTEDDRVAAIEQTRIDEIKAKIDDIKSQSYSLSQLSANRLEALIQLVKNFDITEYEFQEFVADAKAAAFNALVELDIALKDRIKRDEAEAERIAEEARLDKIREEQKAEREEAEAKQLELDSRQAQIDVTMQELANAKAELEVEKKTAEDKKIREAFEKYAKEEARIQAEKDAKEKAEREEKARLAKEEAEKAEKAKLEALQPDRDKLEAWANEILDMRPPKLESIAAKKIADNMLTTIFQAVNGLLAQSKNL